MTVLARTRVGGSPKEKINAAVACRDRSCPYLGAIYSRDDLLTLDPKGFHQKAFVVDDWTHRLYGQYHSESAASQDTDFDRLWMRSAGRIDITYVGGKGQPRNRSIAVADGHVHFRVTGSNHYFVASGRFDLSQPGGLATRGVVSMTWVADSGGGGTNAHWRSELRRGAHTGKATDIRRTGVLKPGLYQLSWSLSDDVGPQSVWRSYQFEIMFGRCAEFHAAGVGQPSNTLETAAQIALAEAWDVTINSANADHSREWGGIIYRVGRLYYHTRPIQGGQQTISGTDLTAEFDKTAAGLKCAGHTIALAGIYHTHPPETNPTYLSFADINQSIEATVPTFMRGRNGEVCGIHTFAPFPNDRTIEALPDSPTNVVPIVPQIPGLSITYPPRQRQEMEDPRRERTEWIPLDAATPLQKTCSSLGEP